MKNKIFKLCLVIITFFTTINLVKANNKTYETDFISDDEIIRCEYHNNEKNDTLYIMFKKNDEQANNYLTMYIKGEQEDRFAIRNDESTAMTKGQLTEYIASKGQCPAYAAKYESAYYFSDSRSDIENGKYILEKFITKSDPNYCFYNYSGAWGMIVKNDFTTGKRGELKSDLFNGETCPTYIVTEIGLSTYNPIVYEENPEYERNYYATNNQSDISRLITECENAAKSQLEEEGDLSRVKCSVGQKQELTSDNNPANEKTKNPEIEINCEFLFDDEMKNIITTAYFGIEIIAIIMMAFLTIKDYAISILNSNADELKKSHKKLLTRILIVIIIFLLPGLIKIMLKVVHIEPFNDDPLCGTVEKSNM